MSIAKVAPTAPVSRFIRWRLHSSSRHASSATFRIDDDSTRETEGSWLDLKSFSDLWIDVSDVVVPGRPRFQTPANWWNTSADGPIRIRLHSWNTLDVTLTEFLLQGRGKVFVHVDALNKHACEVGLTLEQSDDGIEWTCVEAVEPFVVTRPRARHLAVGPATHSFDPPLGRHTRLVADFRRPGARVELQIWRGEAEP